MIKEIGMMNLSEAQVHNQCRTRAELFRKASASTATTAAADVDCHRWFANAEKT
jgi:hypothetical protein